MISVIIPVYNAEKFLERAISSACEQPEVSEIIVVEDGSPDGSLEKCRELVSRYPSRIKLFQHNDCQNHGAGASRNLGITNAKCELISFLDADDFYLNNRFSKDVKILNDNPCVDGVYNALGVHVYEDSVLNRIDFNLTTVKYPIRPSDLFEEMAPLGEGGYFSGDTLTVRRNIFDKVGLFETRLKLSQDTHMWIKMAAKATLVPGIIDNPVAMRGVHSANRIKEKNQFLYYRFFLFKYLLAWANENNLPISRKMILWNQLYKFYCKSLYAQENIIFARRFKVLLFLFKQGIKNPYLLNSRRYYSAIIKSIIR